MNWPGNRPKAGCDISLLLVPNVCALPRDEVLISRQWVRATYPRLPCSRCELPHPWRETFARFHLDERSLDLAIVLQCGAHRPAGLDTVTAAVKLVVLMAETSMKFFITARD